MRHTHANVAFEFVGVKNVQRARHVVVDVISDVDQWRNGAQTNGGQTVFQPFGGGGVIVDTFDVASDIGWASVFSLNRDLNRRGESALGFANVQGFERAQSGSSQITRNTANTKTFGAVGRD